MLGDLASLKSVAALADQVKAKVGVLDALWNNAGGMTDEKKLSDDGVEYQMAVNHLAPFALTKLLLPLLEKAPQGRVISTCSMAQGFASGSIERWFEEDGKKYRPFAVYGKAKLADMLFTQELASRLKDTAITVHAFHPGWVNTGFGSGGTERKASAMAFFSSIFALSPAKGADTGVFLVAASEPGECTGLYWSKRKRIRPSKLANPDNAKRLWEQSQSLVDKALGS